MIASGTFSETKLRLDHVCGKKYAILVHDLIYRDLLGRIHRAVAGMPTDGLTIPRFFWRIAGAPFLHPYLLAAIIHDHYCYKAASLPVGRERNTLRLSGDKLFREMVQELGANKGVAWMLYRSVRIGAWSTRLDPPRLDYIHDHDEFMAEYIAKKTA